MQGQLFTQEFLTRGITDTPPHQALSDAAFAAFSDHLRSIFQGLDGASTINEAQTEQLVINKVLAELGWADDTLPQVNADPRGREAVPDCLLFASPQAKAAALAEAKDDRRYRHGLAILEAKRWLRPLDRGDGKDVFDPDAPSSQMLRYLSRIDVASDRAVKWGILTNGAVWRLYWQDARSRSEEFFEVNLAAALGLPGIQHELDEAPPAQTLKLFYLFFGRNAFLPQEWDNTGRTFHAYALNEARLYEEKVSQDLGSRVFAEIFPQLADALARGDLQAKTQEVGYGQSKRQQFTREYLDEVREAALVLLYRLLFLFYAEDRNLLPVRDERYAPYSVRRIREEVRDKVDAGTKFSRTVGWIWLALKNTFTLIDAGDDSVGMPGYNGGLFDRARAPLLERTRVTDAVMAPIIDALSRRTEDLLHGWINYRDLSVSHLGGIYERLLEYTLVHDEHITAQPASFARKVSGSYYTHDDLVQLILRESVGLLATERMAVFTNKLKAWRHKKSLGQAQWNLLDGNDGERITSIDPASQILELKICDPAMGSGHFLVALVDDLADRVLEAINTGTHLVNEQSWAAHLVESGRPWVSPLVARIADIRRSIKTTAKNHGWAVTEAQLDDRHIVRRMILKKCIFGVDKNPMAVELAKTALWLHTFTVGAPLSFLDHHLKVGDSLHGERLPQVQRNLEQLGALLMQSEFDRLALAAENIAQVADLTDVDITEAQLSKQLAQAAAAQVAPIHAVLDFWRALRWLVPGWPVDKIDKLGKLLKVAKDETNPVLEGLIKLFDPTYNLVGVLAAGHLDGSDTATQAANNLMAQARALSKRESFFHWWTSFPNVFGSGGGSAKSGFDAVIGNPPWDMLQMQEVEWFAERVREIASQPRASDRKKRIANLAQTHPAVWVDFLAASERSEQEQRVVRKCGDFPLMASGRTNLYQLFIERAEALVHRDGIVAMLTPSGIAADQGASKFFQSISISKRLGLLFDFENKGRFFPDVHDNFKFVAIVFGGKARFFLNSRCAFYLHRCEELTQAGRVLALTAEDFEMLNPNTGAAPVFRVQRDADITLHLYRKNPVLVRHGVPSVSLGRTADAKVWPIKFYQGMFNMTADSGLFRKAEELSAEGYTRAKSNTWEKDGNRALPLLVGKMIWHYDHRACSVTVNESSMQVATSSLLTTEAQHTNPFFFPEPQYWVKQIVSSDLYGWALAFRDITNPTNERTAIAAIVPNRCAGNTLPLLLPLGPDAEASAAHWIPLLLANFNCMAFDYVTRQKAKWTHLNWFILEQLPVIAPERFQQPLPADFAQAMRAAKLMNGHHLHPTVADFVIPQVLALTYTAHDMAPFARDLGYVDAAGKVLPPFIWNDEERRARTAALDALFFYLYGLNADDAAYILDTFPIVREQDIKAFGRYRTQDNILAGLALCQLIPAS